MESWQGSSPWQQQNKTEMVTYMSMTVKILGAKLLSSADFFSKSDCYILLSLPTASAKKYSTKVLHNTQNPEWNETFTMRVPVLLKNVLEIELHDYDCFNCDDHMSTVLFDLAKLNPGKAETKTFKLNPENEDELQVEFELVQSNDPPQEYVSNGIVMVAPCSVLDVKNPPNSGCKGENVLKVTGSYQDTQPINCENQTLRYHINRDLVTEIGILSSKDAAEANVKLESSYELPPIPAQFSGKASLVIDETFVDLDLEAQQCSGFEVRVSPNIPAMEKEFLLKRKPKVAKALEKVLKLPFSPDSLKAPVIAIAGSGGGSRAMTGLLGSLRGLKEIGVLDTVTYFTGVSGSTWAMSALYQEPNWSDLPIDDQISIRKENMTKSISDFLSPELLGYYKEEMEKKKEQGYRAAFFDLAGLFFEQLIFNEKVTSLLSEQRVAVKEGQNPLPIYTAVNMEEGIRRVKEEMEWIEFTPFEVGLQKYASYTPTEIFGSEFYLGGLVRKLPELRIPFLIGMWSSAESISVNKLWEKATGQKTPWSSELEIIASAYESDSDPITLDTVVINPPSKLTDAVCEVLKGEPVITTVYNFMRDFFLRWNYTENGYFTADKDFQHPDALPNQLTPREALLHPVDSGHGIKIACAPVLRPERGADVIITLGYAWEGERFLKIIEDTAIYCKDHNLPFPNADFAQLEKEDHKEFYIFEDEGNPKAPIVIHFPLLNVTYRDFKSPREKRVTEDEKEAGKIDVTSDSSPYRTSNFTYSAEDYEALVNLTTYNILNNKENILEVLNKALRRKMPKFALPPQMKFA